MPSPTDPQASTAKFLQNQEAIRSLLGNPDAQKLLQALRQKDPTQLQNAAQSAMQGDISGLKKLLGELSAQPDTAQAAENLSQKRSK